MDKEPTVSPEAEPTTAELVVMNRAALERASEDPTLADMAAELVITPEDEEALYYNDDGSEVDPEAAWGNTVGWWMQLGLDPEDYFDPGFIEKLAKE